MEQFRNFKNSIMGKFTEKVKSKLKDPVVVKMNAVQKKKLQETISNLMEAEKSVGSIKENINSFLIGIGVEHDKVDSFRIVSDGLEIKYR